VVFARVCAFGVKQKEVKMISNIEKVVPVPHFTGHKGDPTKLLEIDDWSKVTPKRLQKYIDDGYTIDWIDGYDVGPTPLTNALMQDAPFEIIEILVNNGADVDLPTVLRNGKRMTPLQIVRSKKPTHENMQIELFLLRAGAKDDIMAWLRQNKYKLTCSGEGLCNLSWMFGRGNCLRNHLSFLGYKGDAKVFQCGYSYLYVMERAGKIWIDCDFDIYDKGMGYTTLSEPEMPQLASVIYNELGDAYAKQFFANCEQLLPNVAMDQYYIYLSSLYLVSGKKSDRIHAAHADLRDHFSYNDWTELIAITSNITACAEYNKQRKKRFPTLYAWFHMDD
jgi:hypothetical protein